MRTHAFQDLGMSEACAVEEKVGHSRCHDVCASAIVGASGTSGPETYGGPGETTSPRTRSRQSCCAQNEKWWPHWEEDATTQDAATIYTTNSDGTVL